MGFWAFLSFSMARFYSFSRRDCMAGYLHKITHGQLKGKAKHSSGKSKNEYSASTDEYQITRENRKQAKCKFQPESIPRRCSINTNNKPELERSYSSHFFPELTFWQFPWQNHKIHLKSHATHPAKKSPPLQLPIEFTVYLLIYLFRLVENGTSSFEWGSFDICDKWHEREIFFFSFTLFSFSFKAFRDLFPMREIGGDPIGVNGNEPQKC